MTQWSDAVGRLRSVLLGTDFTDADGRRLDSDEGFATWTRETKAVRSRNQAVFLIGNGASASMASHFAADLAKNAHVHTEVFTDLALITAISNDIGYEAVYAEPLRRRGRPGDMLVAISSSGASPNVIAAAHEARERQLSVVTLSSLSSENPLRRLGTLNVYLPGTTYGESETGHAAVLHHWMDMIIDSKEDVHA